eukprot:gene8951-14401_t
MARDSRWVGGDVGDGVAGDGAADGGGDGGAVGAALTRAHVWPVWSSHPARQTPPGPASQPWLPSPHACTVGDHDGLPVGAAEGAG